MESTVKMDNLDIKDLDHLRLLLIKKANLTLLLLCVGSFSLFCLSVA
jgi:hypothetical protein